MLSQFINKKNFHSCQVGHLIYLSGYRREKLHLNSYQTISQFEVCRRYQGCRQSNTVHEISTVETSDSSDHNVLLYISSDHKVAADITTQINKCADLHSANQRPVFYRKVNVQCIFTVIRSIHILVITTFALIITF